MALFDGLQAAVFGATETVFGDDAVWMPSNGETGPFTEKVLYKCPNDPIKIGETDKYEYRPYDYSVEFYETQFPGLKESVDKSNEEKIDVKGVTLVIRAVYRSKDGKTLIAYGELQA